ncbi:hypothetical protein SOVF_213710, partial [Spinacia oleracea]
MKMKLRVGRAVWVRENGGVDDWMLPEGGRDWEWGWWLRGRSGGP